jgi:hypothetical protein
MVGQLDISFKYDREAYLYRESIPVVSFLEWSMPLRRWWSRTLCPLETEVG